MGTANAEDLWCRIWAARLWVWDVGCTASGGGGAGGVEGSCTRVPQEVWGCFKLVKKYKKSLDNHQHISQYIRFQP